MKYEKPKCDCGEELVIWKSYLVLKKWTIKKNGKMSKYPIIMDENSESGLTLKCLKCDKEYWYQEIDGRIYREDTCV